MNELRLPNGEPPQLVKRRRADPRGLDKPFDTVKGFDKSCNYDPVSDPNVHALVAVYSSGGDLDRAAAEDQCSAHHQSFAFTMG